MAKYSVGDTVSFAVGRALYIGRITWLDDSQAKVTVTQAQRGQEFVLPLSRLHK